RTRSLGVIGGSVDLCRGGECYHPQAPHVVSACHHGVLGGANRTRHKVLHPGLPNRELALPTIFMNDLPFWVGALGLAAVFSAEVSAADAVLFMVATSLSQDLYKRFLEPAATARQGLIA